VGSKAARINEDTRPVPVSPATPATGLAFVTHPPDVRQTGWHPSQRRPFVVIFDGEYELETTDGDRRRFRPSEVLLAEDLQGRGHVTRALTDRPASFGAIPLA
jgi:hypothetical protein